MNIISASAFSVALAGLAAGSASASTVTLNFLDPGTGTDVTAQIDGDQVEDSGNGEFFAGTLLMGGYPSAEDQFLAWCLEVSRVIMPSASYTVSYGLPSDKEQDVSRLFTGYIGQTSNEIGAAAFQLALWEIIEEPEDTFDLSNGLFTAQSSTDDVIDTATDFLDGFGAFDPNYRITFFQSGESQDLITATPIPLPASVLFLGAGLGALSLAGRRRKMKAANA